MPAIVTTHNADDAVEDLLARRGRQLTRLVDMFWSGADVITLGKKLRRMSDDDVASFEAGASDKEQRLLSLVNKLKELEPTLIERLSQPGAGAATRDAKTQLNNGQSNGKSEDMRKVREDLGLWRTWVPPLPESKGGRGLNHIECAFFLSPPTEVDWENEDARTQFISFGNPPMDPSLWPRYLWPEEGYNRDRPSDGVLQGELLIKAAQAILFSRQSAKTPSTMQVSGSRGYSKRRNMIGIAKTYELTAITGPFIAYVAVVVRHALTSDDPFGDTCGGFNYIEFYNQLREFLEDPMYQLRAARLVEWWNKQLFSGYQCGNPVGPSQLRKSGTLAILAAEPDTEPETQPRKDD